MALSQNSLLLTVDFFKDRSTKLLWKFWPRFGFISAVLYTFGYIRLILFTWYQFVLGVTTVITIKYITLENAFKYVNEIYNMKNELSKL